MVEGDGERAFGWRGWVLLVAILITFLVVPAIITLRPPTGVSFRFAYLILPLVPAILLAVLAVWATTRP